MQIQLKQTDIEQAVKDYVLKMGLNREVEDIAFTVSRKGGAAITADIRISDFMVPKQVDVVAPITENEPVQAITAQRPGLVEVAVAPVVGEPVKEEEPAPYVTGNVADQSEEEQVEMPTPTKPFDAVEEEEESEAPVTATRSLFG